ncbi:hypothetical protein Q8A67_021192 [Cirrhinus molitorella]|uniref:Ig-like domain-containing protein n=1 Tax=Cirrhinus molitorella TaxID=172907 RepID=A0AA88P9A8_9TELE|nr:hypothetical protein Q8A67_021192 [Cirrhinus molitorella]
MELLVVIVFHLLVEIQTYNASIVDQCYFITNREEKNIKVSSSCELELTGAEVLRLAAAKSPVLIFIICNYTINEQVINKPSSSSFNSLPAKVMVLDSLQKPKISVSKEDDLLLIACEIPLSIRADFICSLYTENDDLLYQSKSHWSQSGGNLCVFNLNHSEVLRRSVNSRQLTCVYSLKSEHENRSPNSDSYIIREFPKVNVSPDVIRESSSVKISCEMQPHVIVNECHFYINREQKKMKTSPSCELELTGAEVLRWAAVKSRVSLNIYCYYIIGGGALISSPDSDPATVTVLVSTSTTTEQTTTTAMKTSLTVISTSGTTTYSKTDSDPATVTVLDIRFIVVISTGVAVILFGLIGHICLCRFASKKRREHNKTRSIKTDPPSQRTGKSCSGSAETHSLITSVPATPQPISGGLKHPESHQDSTPDPTLHITSVNLIYQPSGVRLK